MTNLPAHLTARTRPAMLQDAIAGLNAGRGPHVSTADNRFTLVDAGGNEKPIQTLYLDVVVVDVNPHPSRVYYDPTKPYKRDDGTPPLCFSDNGTAPSANAQSPQSNLCQLCPKADWSSAVAMGGGTKPACSNGKKLAVIAGGAGEMVFALKVPPASLKNWLAYCKYLRQNGVEPYDVYTRIEFESQGVLKFSDAPIGDKGLSYVHASVVELTEKLWATKATVEATNKEDQPWTGQADAQKIAYAQQQAPAIAAPASPAPAPAGPAPAPMAPPPQPFGGQQAQPMTQANALAGNNQFGGQQAAASPFGQPSTSSPTDVTPPKRTRGPNKNKAQEAPPFGPAASTMMTSPSDDGIPPFLRRDGQNQPPVAPAPNPTQFGMQAAPAAPDAGVQAALDAAFRLPT
jgi:hypothetical protein